MLRPDRRTLALLCLLALLILAAGIHVRLWPTETKGEDVYYAWVEGGRILNGDNPYARILAGNMRENQKYATYFPVFYELSALTQWAGLRDYPQWIAFWRSVFLVCHLVIGVLLFLLPYRRRWYAFALFAAAFWLFNRWSLHVAQIAHLDVLALLPLVASLALFDRRRRTALLLFSLSLGLKQIAIFLVPLYLIWVWREAGGRARWRTVAAAAAWIALVPLAASLPFIVWQPEGFIRSIAFSATRLPADHFNVPSADALVGWVGLTARLPMLGLMAAAFWLAWRGMIGRWVAALLVMAVFVDFNTVLFRQYLAWIIPFLPLAALELAPKLRPLEENGRG
jgi:uncharacterized membrane protein